jgi:putative addiction module component (TIGR02574 family)
MTRELLNELLKLSPAERFELAQDLWDSVEPGDMPPPTAEQIQEAERRYAELERDPGKGLTWEEVKARLLARYGNADPTESQKDPT